MNADSEMPHGTPRSAAVAHLPRDDQAARLVEQAARRRAHDERGIRYSNIDPDHETSAEPRPTGVSGRPSWNQWSAATSPLAIAMKLVRRASEASRS